MRRFAILAVLSGLVVGAVMAAPAIADPPDGLNGRWVAIDIDDSYWQATFSPGGTFNSIDSATIPCLGYRSSVRGPFEEVSANRFVVSYEVRCLQGDLAGSVVLNGTVTFIYDPAAGTILQPFDLLDPQPPSGRDVTFCRLPCDPYAYVP